MWQEKVYMFVVTPKGMLGNSALCPLSPPSLRWTQQCGCSAMHWINSSRCDTTPVANSLAAQLFPLTSNNKAMSTWQHFRLFSLAKYIQRRVVLYCPPPSSL
jgi:hypothetical protein